MSNMQLFLDTRKLKEESDQLLTILQHKTSILGKNCHPILQHSTVILPSVNCKASSSPQSITVDSMSLRMEWTASREFFLPKILSNGFDISLAFVLHDLRADCFDVIALVAERAILSGYISGTKESHRPGLRAPSV